MKQFISLNDFTDEKSVDNSKILDNQIVLVITPKFQIQMEIPSIII